MGTVRVLHPYNIPTEHRGTLKVLKFILTLIM